MVCCIHSFKHFCFFREINFTRFKKNIFVIFHEYFRYLKTEGDCYILRKLTVTLLNSISSKQAIWARVTQDAKNAKKMLDFSLFPNFCQQQQYHPVRILLGKRRNFYLLNYFK